MRVAYAIEINPCSISLLKGEKMCIQAGKWTSPEYRYPTLYSGVLTTVYYVVEFDCMAL